MNKPRIFTFGACDLDDAVNINEIKSEFDLVNDKIHSYTGLSTSFSLNYRAKSKSTSMMSLYSEPGPIAERVFDSLRTKKEKLDFRDFMIAEETMKFPFIEFFRKNATPNDFLVVNLSTELYTKLRVKQECMTLQPHFIGFAKDSTYLKWIYDEYFTKEYFHVPFDQEDSLLESTSLIKQFAKDLHPIFKDRLIFVKTHLSGFELGNTDRLVEHKVGCERWIPFFKKSRIVTDPLDHNYAKRAAEISMQKFLRSYSSDIPAVVINDNECFIDPNHRFGWAPFHLHPVTTHKIGMEIYKHLKAIQERNNKQQLLQDK